MGIVPGGGGTQYLTSRIGRHRALEVVLGADLFDAETAERYGWVNRALPAEELDDFATVPHLLVVPRRPASSSRRPTRLRRRCSAASSRRSGTVLQAATSAP